ncbi:aldehyde dehydrogenase family protein [Persicimonas caeni]|uniref:Aldehyde dehydrogenase family protein n=1 Tax=Persicimonas caeni TaxID=2292766 RepID=A0A4Y6PN11_PERCE|nr:aldehyde dehydrogenase family protein [Persicimonas caeni]QDG49664.1 aldehyde dehydrogenase family protein [Persicimonas caeni]QED30885.1 aldehyde dehydrogenase family protein [Persicimonas caeni]
MSASAESYPTPGTFSPATGAELEPVEQTHVDEVKDTVERARAAQKEWRLTTLHEREEAMQAIARRVLERADEIVEIISQETGKNPSEILVNEVSGIAEYAKIAAKEAKAALSPVKVSISKIAYPGKSATVEPVPRGVIGIIAPWNYPLSIFYKPLFPALLSGNGVVLKPSEFTPRTGAWLVEQCQAVLPEGLVRVVQGGGEVGEALIESGIDGLTFTGSVATGKKIAARCGELLIPCSVELGGKDAAIVLADCDLDRTAIGIAQWALHNCGQNCAAIERVYVEDAIADRFVEKLGQIVEKVRVAGEGELCEIGPLQNHQQLDIVEAHVRDALDKGAELVTGGERTGSGLGYRPTVLDRCTAEMEVVTDETFGPVIAVVRVQDADEAVDKANAARYGLNGSVWTKNLARGEEIARRLEVGVALVNNHAIVGSMANVPWTGVKDTGTGVAASRFSYHTFVRPRTVFIDKSSKPDPWWFPANEDLQELGETLVDFSLGSLTSVLRLAKVAGRRVKAIQKLARGD